MSICAVAIVSATNCPLLIRTYLDDKNEEEATKLIYLLHASLDIVQEKSDQPQSRDCFLGVLYQCEKYKIYGLMSTTKIKVLLMVANKANQTLREGEVRVMLKTIHTAYIECTAMNPFYQPDQPVKSKRLDTTVESMINQTQFILNE